MRVHVLASGSTGNCIYLQLGDANLLVDAGISARRIKTGLDAVGSAVGALDGILLTHEHRDHISGLETLVRKYHLPVYAQPGTWEALPKSADFPAACRRELNGALEIRDVRIEPFSISHDAADPVGFCFYHQDTKCSVATDIGFVTEKVRQALSYSDVLILESNHDVDLLTTGGYPWYLKRRILSSRGHLSNNDAGWVLARLPKKKHMDVFLAHMSQQNNRPELAEQTIRGIIEQEGYAVGKDITLHLTFPDRTASLP